MVVIAVGVKPNIEFLNGSGIKTDRGILVNSNMETNIKNIYAAGDCTAAKEILTGKTMPIPIIPLASQQGMTVGCNMAGKKKEYKGGLSLNALQFGGAQIISYGFIRDEANGEILKKLDEKQGIYKKIIIKKNKITGAVFVRAIERAGIFRYLIENKVDIGKYKDKLLEPDFNWAHVQNETRDQLFLRSQ
jgi:NAD(P)H-nitrite reductase large subunit